ncbi:MAG TPA: type II secretion system secretin GspD, partial [Methylococcaceae bacterium]|nr:type II secretion system secretin GspD [Methylococcaceae bacterium]
MNNNNAPIRKGTHSLIAAAVTIALGLAGCQHMDSIVAKKAPVPPSLIMREKKPAEPETKPEEAMAVKRGVTEKEYYPPSGSLVGPSAGTPAVPPAREGKYTLNFDDADLAEVTKVILGDTLKVNYVLSPKVTGKVSLQTTRPLTDDELIPTLEMLLQTNGAALIKDGPIYRIEPEGGAVMATPGARLGLAGQGLPPGYQLRVVPLRYVSVKDMQKVIEPLMPPKSVVRVDEIRNLLMLAGSSEEMESAIETIRLFDVDFMRGMTVGIYPLKNVDAATIVQELDKLLGDIVKGPLAGMLRLLPIQRLNAILVVSPQPRYLDEVESWIERLDRYDTGKATGNMHVYRVQNVDAVQLAQTLSQIFGGGAAARGTPAAQLAPGLTGAAISGGAFGGTASAFGGTGGAFGGTGGAFGGTGGTFGGTGTGGFGGGMGAYQVEDQGIGGTTTGTGTTGGGQIGTGASSTGGLGGGMAGGTLGGGTTSGRAGPRGSVVAELGNDRRIVADPANNALIIFAKAQDYKDIEAVIKELDVLPLQVLIDATIAEVTLTGKLEYGIKWLLTQGSNSEALAAGGSNLLEKIKNIAITGSGPGGFAYAFAGKDIKVLLTALANDNKVNVVSSPSLMVLNNQEANINVGDKVPTSSGGGIITTTGAVSSPSIQYVESGVILK